MGDWARLLGYTRFYVVFHLFGEKICQTKMHVLKFIQ